MILHEAASRQIAAADPGFSTWLSANAGSGKTTVLTSRVARLLLGGTDPAHILCLTYTKAAASEMQNRLFRRLGQWAMLPAPQLHKALTDLGLPGPHDAQTLATARRLFARAIETPGGLRIQTIHSFCASLLRRFPLEAGVTPQFSEMDERSARLMRADIVQEMAGGLAPAAVSDLGMLLDSADLDRLLTEVAAIGSVSCLTPQAARAAFAVPPGESRDTILRNVFLGDEADILSDLEGLLLLGTEAEAKLPPKIAAIRVMGATLRGQLALEDRFLFGEKTKSPFGAKIGDFPTKALRNGAAAELMPRLDALMARVESGRVRRIALAASERTAALYRFAGAFLPLYEARKSARGWLDFDDLIRLATRLLSDPGVAAWVLYRLDGGIGHILVDEAQDTSPAQWRVIEALAAEFTAGQSSHQGARTLFVVGDKKQSIYSFQGANVAIFDRKRDHFSDAFGAARLPFAMTSLDHSFRSSPAILNLVDALFQEPEFAGAIGEEVQHFAFHSGLPGRVELWPDIPPETVEPDRNWQDPVDLVTPRHHTAILAQEVAARIKAMLESGAQIAAQDGLRAVQPGDFLILVQKRQALFAELIRACKQAGLPIAGADRLKLAAEMAVRDLTSMLAFLATPEDDLSLAEVLRSPLVGLSESDLFSLAHGRQGFLWTALRGAGDRLPAAVDLLTDLLDNADFLRPFDLLERILIRHDGRRRLLARLGDEAEEGIDAFRQQALNYESADVPSLTGFLSWLQGDTLEIKRQVDGEGDRIRIMTVHGAKGLEAEIVILPDCADHSSSEKGLVMNDGDAPPLWVEPAGDQPKAMQDRAAARALQRNEENLRLLYVALTRARSMLIIAAAGETKLEVNKKPKPVTDLCWYRLVQRALERLNPQDVGDQGRVYSFGDFPAPQIQGRASPAQVPPLPEWATTPHRLPDRPLPPLSPSSFGGTKALPGELADGADPALADHALRRGTAIHLLLEHLPGTAQADWPALAAALISDAPLRDDALAVAARNLASPPLAPCFAPGALREVAITGEWQGRRLTGAIDRLIVTETEVTLIDFKSNRLVPENPGAVPEGLLRQMAAYAHLLAQIYPGRPLRPFILWTETASLMPLDPDMLMQALDRATIP